MCVPCCQTSAFYYHLIRNKDRGSWKADNVQGDLIANVMNGDGMRTSCTLIKKKRGVDLVHAWPSYGTLRAVCRGNLSGCLGTLRNCKHVYNPSGRDHSSLWGSGAFSPAQYGKCRLLISLQSDSSNQVMFCWMKVLDLNVQRNSAMFRILFRNTNW